jgi:hypothetical protein
VAVRIRIIVVAAGMGCSFLDQWGDLGAMGGEVRIALVNRQPPARKLSLRQPGIQSP